MSSALQRVISNVLALVGKTNLATGFTLEGGTTNKVLTVDETVAMSAKLTGSYATVAEVKTGAEAAKVVAPSTMIGHEGVVKGWATFAVAGDILDSFNVSGITDSGTGSATVTWDIDFGNTSYSCNVSLITNGGIAGAWVSPNIQGRTAGSVNVEARKYDTSLIDPTSWNVIAIGDR
jgi:hypothetical protein